MSKLSIAIDAVERDGRDARRTTASRAARAPRRRSGRRRSERRVGCAASRRASSSMAAVPEALSSAPLRIAFPASGSSASVARPAEVVEVSAEDDVLAGRAGSRPGTMPTTFWVGTPSGLPSWAISAPLRDEELEVAQAAVPGRIAPGGVASVGQGRRPRAAGGGRARRRRYRCRPSPCRDPRADRQPDRRCHSDSVGVRTSRRSAALRASAGGAQHWDQKGERESEDGSGTTHRRAHRLEGGVPNPNRGATGR